MHTGHIDIEEDLNRGTPSVDKPSASRFSLLKNCPSVQNDFIVDPFHISVITLFSVFNSV